MVLSIEDYFGDWTTVLPAKEELERYAEGIKNMAKRGVSFEPKANQVFKAFRLCSLKDCKAIIVGQDPYPQHGIATGIAFGNPLDLCPISPSLRVIKESIFSLGNPEEIHTFDQSLESWEKQGILLLNSSLTVETNHPGSHVGIWKPFISKFIENTSKARPDIFWLFLGQQAIDFKYNLAEGAHRLMEYHPAYYIRTGRKMNPFVWRELIKYVEEVYGVTLHLYD